MILHVNIRSLHKNFETLNHELIHSFDYHPDVICLTETKLKDAPLTNVFLIDYEHIIHANSVANAIEVGVYVSSKFFSFAIEKNDLLLNCENIWLQINNTITDDTFILGILHTVIPKVMKKIVFRL